MARALRCHWRGKGRNHTFIAPRPLRIGRVLISQTSTLIRDAGPAAGENSMPCAPAGGYTRLVIAARPALREDLDRRSVHQDHQVQRCLAVGERRRGAHRESRAEVSEAGMRAVHKEFAVPDSPLWCTSPLPPAVSIRLRRWSRSAIRSGSPDLLLQRPVEVRRVQCRAR